jgi:protein gp37
MSDGTKISWSDATWPVTAGCEHVSDGCERCYAANLTSGRLKHLPAYSGLAENGRFNGQIRLLPDRLDWPYKWRKPRKIFVADMSDLFYDQVPDGYIARVWDVMAHNGQHTFQVLTKRHARMRSWMRRWADRTGDRAGDSPETGMPPMPRGPEAFRASAYTSGRSSLFAAMLDSMGTPPEGCAYPLYDWMEGWRFWPTELFNVWLGVSAEDQHWADIRIPALLETPAAVRFVSAEPLLGPIRLFGNVGQPGPADHVEGYTIRTDYGTGTEHDIDVQPGIDWVIAGGESGPGHRPMDIAWLESIVEQCQNAGVAVWVKQDSGPRAGQQGRIPDRLWIHEFPLAADLAGAA